MFLRFFVSLLVILSMAGCGDANTKKNVKKEQSLSVPANAPKALIVRTKLDDVSKIETVAIDAEPAIISEDSVRSAFATGKSVNLVRSLLKDDAEGESSSDQYFWGGALW